MVNRDRMVEEFLYLVQIDSLSLKEKPMADELKARVEALGLEVQVDNAGEKTGGNTGNLICTLKGGAGIAPILLAAHMDTVGPGTGKNPIVEGDIIRSDGTTVLGGDDAAGIACILEAVRVLKEDGIPHGDIQIVFTIGEEIGLMGSKNLDFSKIRAKYGFVMDDGGSIGHVAVQAPSHNKMDIVIHGKAAHAGMEPEKGINAMGIAAHAIAGMKLGRIDGETTANIGIISGGKATNIVMDRLEIKAEARSRDEAKLLQQTSHMKECFESAAAKLGGKVDFSVSSEYAAFHIRESDAIVSILKKAAEDTGVELKLEATGGGSDTNIFNSKGIQAVDVSVGMDKIHSVEEQISIEDMVKAARFLVAIIKSVKN